MKTHEDTDRHPTDLKSARMNYPNSTMQPFVLQNASVDFQYPKPALSYKNTHIIFVPNYIEILLEAFVLNRTFGFTIIPSFV